MSPRAEVVAAFDALPLGSYGATFEGRRWRISKAQLAMGRSQKLEAEELGGTGRIGLNVFRLADGSVILKPCEVEEHVVATFLLGVDAD